MVTGVFASAKDVNVNNVVALEKTETANVVAKNDDGGVCVGTVITIVEEDETSITIIEIVEVICAFF